MILLDRSFAVKLASVQYLIFPCSPAIRIDEAACLVEVFIPCLSLVVHETLSACISGEDVPEEPGKDCLENDNVGVASHFVRKGVSVA